MIKTAFLVDADFFLRQHKYHLGKQASADPEEVAEALWKQCIRHLYKSKKQQKEKGGKTQVGRLYRIFVYDCKPLTKKVHHPRTGQAIDLAKSDLAKFRAAFHQALIHRPNTALRLGYLDESSAEWTIANQSKLKDVLSGKLDIISLQDSDFIYYARQKAVDMKLGLDIATLAYKEQVERIVLIAGDSDFVPAAKLARREGIEFILDPMWKVIRSDLREHIDGLRSTIRKKPVSGGENGST